MGRKIPNLISATIMTAIVSTTLSPSLPTRASSFNEEFGEIWSIEEAKNYYYEVETERNALCGDDFECRWMFNDEHRNQHPKYRIASAYSTSNFFITAINPELNIVRAYYRDLDSEAMEMGMGEVHLPLTELQLVWLDSNYNPYGISFIETLRDGLSLQGVHPIYNASTELNGAGWFPVETEVQIAAPEANLSENGANVIEYFAAFTPSATLGTSNYSSCVQSTDYEPGMECRLMFKERGGYAYIPFMVDADDDELTTTNITQPTTEPDSGLDTESTNMADESPQPITMSDIPSVTEDSLITTDSDENAHLAENISEEQLTSDNYVKAEIENHILSPNTGMGATPKDNNINHNHGGTDLNWLIIAVSILCIIPVIWLALPNRRKNRKNCKKGIDK